MVVTCAKENRLLRDDADLAAHVLDRQGGNVRTIQRDDASKRHTHTHTQASVHSGVCLSTYDGEVLFACFNVVESRN